MLLNCVLYVYVYRSIFAYSTVTAVAAPQAAIGLCSETLVHKLVFELSKCLGLCIDFMFVMYFSTAVC